MSIELRDYQRTCVNLVLESYDKCSNNNELLVLPTGSGKTLVFSSVIDALARGHGTNALILAHRDELLDQAADKYRMIEPTAIIGKIAGNIREYGAPITVASIATVSRQRHLKQLKTFYGEGKGLIIIVDEAHHSEADGYQRVLEAFPQAFVLMVTATPDRLDGKPLLDGKKPLYSRSIIDMVKEKYLCSFKAIAIRTETNLDDIKSRMGDFNQEELDLAVNTPARNKRVVDAYLEYCSGKRAICFAVTIAHAEALCYAFNDAGINAAVVVGDTPMSERKKLYAQLESGELLVICNVMVLTEGFDSPAVECVIMARPTQSRALYVQCIGRGLRLYPGKEYCTILDLTDNCLRHKLTPITLKKAIGKEMLDDETVEEALAREEQEERERIAMVRKLPQKRVKDIVINLLESIEWRELDNGTFVVEVGRAKHRIALVPRKDDASQFEVWARVSPDFKQQKWASAQPLDDAAAFAEMRVQDIINEPTNIKLYDRFQPWRQTPASDKQKKTLEWFKIPFQENVTKDQADMLINEHKAEIARKKAAAAARKAQRAMA